MVIRLLFPKMYIVVSFLFALFSMIECSSVQFQTMRRAIELHTPRVRFTAALMTDPCLGDRILIFGGQNATSSFGDLWQISLNIVKQFPISATGSSEFGSDNMWIDYSYASATGEFDVPDWVDCADQFASWSPWYNDRNEYIEFKYATPVKPTLVSVHETLAAPFLTGMFWGQGNASVAVPSFVDTTPCPGYFNLQCSPIADGFLVDTVRLTTYSKGYAEVDSVMLQGTQEGALGGERLSVGGPDEQIVPLGETGSVALGTKFVVWGGIKQNRGFNNIPYMYDIQTREWTQLLAPPPSIIGRNGPSVVLMCQKIWSFFGNSPLGFFDGSVITVFDAFTVGGQWSATTLPSTAAFPGGRRQTGYAVQNVGQSQVMWTYGGRMGQTNFGKDLWKFTPDCSRNSGNWTDYTSSATVAVGSSRPIGLWGPNMNEYQGELWLFNGSPIPGVDALPFATMFVYNIANNQWRSLNALNPPMLYASGLKHQSTVHNGLLYLIGTRVMSKDEANVVNYDPKNNNLFIFNFTSTSWLATLQPSSRRHHSAVLYNTRLYVFGGLSDQIGILQDTWVLDANDVWTPVVIQSPPPARYGHCAVAVAGIMYLFGGMSLGGPLMDVWSMDLTVPVDKLQWGIVEVANAPPTARYWHSCSIVQTWFVSMVMFGGMGISGALGDMYVFLFLDKTWNQLTPDHLYLSAPSRQAAGNTTVTWPGPRGAHHAMILYEPYTRMILMGGTTATDFSTIVDDGWEYNFSLGKQGWTKLYDATMMWSMDAPLAQLPGGAAAAFGTQIIFFGGAFYQSFSLSSSYSMFLLRMDTPTNASNMVANTQQSILGTVDRGRFGHTMTAIGNTLLVIGGKTTLMQLNEVLNIVLPNPCSSQMYQTDKTCTMCAPGSYYSAAARGCLLCAAGTYSSLAGSSACTPCPKGFISNEVGAWMGGLCIPCRAGTKINPAVPNSCIPCNTDVETCIVATSVPLKAATMSTINISSAAQPPTSIENTSYVNRVSYSLYGAGAGLFFISAIVIFLSRDNPTVKKILYNMDIFKEHHMEKPKFATSNGRMAEIAIAHPKFLGGFVAVMYFIGLVIMVGISTLQFLTQNTLITQALLPVALFEAQTHANIHAEVTVHNWNPQCTAAGSNQGCFEGIQVFADGITLQENNLGSTTTQCYDETDDFGMRTCRMAWTCNNCNVTQKDSTVTFQFGKYEGVANSYASYFTYAIKSSAGIPLESSSVGGNLVPPQPGKCIRGATVPSSSTLAITPTQYINQIDNTNGTGYHLSELGRSFGTLTDADTFIYENGVNFQFSLQQDPSFLQIVLQSKQTPIQFLSNIMALVSGLMGVFAIVLAVIEMAKDFFETKIQKKEKTSSFLNFRQLMPSDEENDEERQLPMYNNFLANLHANTCHVHCDNNSGSSHNNDNSSDNATANNDLHNHHNNSNSSSDDDHHINPGSVGDLGDMEGNNENENENENDIRDDYDYNDVDWSWAKSRGRDVRFC